MNSHSLNNYAQVLILIVSVLACSRSIAQRPDSAGLEVIYSSKQSNVRIDFTDSVFHAATLSNNGEFLLHSDSVVGQVKLVDLKTLKIDTVKVDRLHNASWFASESQHIYEIRSTSPSISKAAAANDGNEDLYCYKSLDDFRNNHVQWSFHNINTTQFVVRWIPELERFLLSNSATPDSNVGGQTTLFLLTENGDIEKEFPVEGCTLDFDCRSNGISVFHNPNFKKVSFKHTQIDHKSGKQISSEKVKSSFTGLVNRQAFAMHFPLGSRYIKLRDLQAGDVIDYFQNFGTVQHVYFQDVPQQYFSDQAPTSDWNVKGVRTWNLNQLAAAQESSMPEIFKVELHTKPVFGGHSQFLLSRNEAYWDLPADQYITDGYFSGDTRLIVTRASEQNDKKTLELITRVISLK